MIGARGEILWLGFLVVISRPVLWPDLMVSAQTLFHGSDKRELLLARSAQPTFLAAELERMQQSHIVFHFQKLGGPKYRPMATPVAVHAKQFGGEE